MTDHRNEQIHTFFSWAWCTLLTVIVVWGIIALAQLHRSGITSPEQGQHTAAVALGLIITAGVCLATGLRKRYPGWLGPLQLAGSWLVFPVFRLIHEVWPRSFDEQLLHLDRLLWAGKSLPQWAMRLEQYWLSEILSLCYFSFYLIIIGSALYFAPRHKPYGYSFFHGIMLMYLFGFLGYIMIPAAGPYAAFPSDFPYPPEGGPITHFLVGIVSRGVTGMDVFPSLHCGIALYIMGFFALIHYRRTAFALLPLFIGITIATVYLRYHYGIDLLAGVMLALGVLHYIRTHLPSIAPRTQESVHVLLSTGGYPGEHPCRR